MRNRNISVSGSAANRFDFWTISLWQSSLDWNFDTLGICYEHLLGAFWCDSESIKELMNSLGYLFWFVFLDHMTNVVYNFHLKFALHVCYRKFFVHTFTSSEDQLLFYLQPKENFRQILEPFNPELLTGEQVCAPYVLFATSFFINSLNHLSWHRDSSASPIFDLATLNSIPDNWFQVLELLWPVLHDSFHEW